jgi:hypothetical protein
MPTYITKADTIDDAFQNLVTAVVDSYGGSGGAIGLVDKMDDAYKHYRYIATIVTDIYYMVCVSEYKQGENGTWILNYIVLKEDVGKEVKINAPL